MLLARPLIRLILAPALAPALSGCPSLTERAGLPPSVERAETLERGGDAAGAARVYEQLASQNSGAERNDLALRAARGYLAAHAREDAARVLAMLEGPLSAEQSTERSLSGIELALERGQNKEAWQQLSALSEPRSGPQAARYRELLSRAALAAGGPGAPPGLAEEAAPHIALLLPVTGRAAARQELLSGGGELLATAAIDASRTDYSGPITELLGLSDSTARFKRLEAAIGTKLVFEPRRRGDVEFIFAPAQPSTERLLRPQ